MKVFCRTMLVMVFLQPLLLFGEIDKEVIVLFKSNALQMPLDNDTVGLGEITTTAEILTCMREIGAEKIIRAMPNFNRADTLTISDDGKTVRLADWSNLYVIEINIDRNSACSKLKLLDGVIYAEKNEKAIPLITTPNDVLFSDRQWNLNDASGNVGIDVMRAWDISRGSNSVIISVIDDGVAVSDPGWHEDLAGRVYGDDHYNEHGTRVAGIIGAITNNNMGIAGVDWNAKINIQYYGNASVPELAQAVYDAVNAGAKILNCSWAFSYSYNETVYDALIWAYALDRLVVASMPADYNGRSFPSAYGPWILTVAGTQRAVGNPPASYTLERHWVDVAAPGGEEGQNNGIMTPWYTNYYDDYHGGTSFAAPHVSGIAGLLLGTNPELRNYDLEWIIKYSATDIAPVGFDDSTGYGLVKAYKAVKHVVLPYEFVRGYVPLTLADEGWVFFSQVALLPYYNVFDAGWYYCKIYKAEVNLDFPVPYSEPPWGWFCITGYEFSNMPSENFWVGQNITTSAATMRTYIYWLEHDFNGNPVSKYVPMDPNLHGYPIEYVFLGRKPIGTPTNLQATEIINSNSIRLTWNDESNNELKYKIDRGIIGGVFNPYDSVDQNIELYIDNGTTPGVKYLYRVRAWAQEFHSGYSNEDWAIAGLSAPTNLFINPVVYSGDSLYWNDNSAIEEGFKIERKIGSGSYAVIYTTGPNATKWFDPGIQPNYEHHYRIKAFTSSYDSDTSNAIVFTPPGIFSDTIKAIDYYHSSRSLFRDNNGHYHLILKHHNGIWYTKSTDNGATWSLAKNLTWIGPEIPSIVATYTGLPCFVWQEKSGTAPNFVYDLVYAYIDGSGNIHKNTLVDNADHLLSPALDITSGNMIFIAFVQTYGTPGKITCLSFSFDSPQYSVYREFATNECASDIRIAIDNQNNPHIVWQETWTVYQYTFWQVGRIYYGRYDGTKYLVHEGWATDQYPPPNVYRVGSPDIAVLTPNLVRFTWSVDRYYPPQAKWLSLYYREKINNSWTTPTNITQDPDIGGSPMLPHIIRNTVFCQANNKIFVAYPNYPTESRMLVENVNNYGAIQVPSGPILGNAAIVYSKNTSIPDFYKICFTIKAIPLPSFNQQVVYSLPPGPPTEFTAYNNAQRLLKDANGSIHLAFTSGDNVYHTYHNPNDTTWSEPAWLGKGKYPALALCADGKLYCTWCYHGYQEFNGVPYYVEYLRMRSFNGVSWSKPTKLLFHTYGTYLWGVGAPSLAIKDTMVYVTFKSYHGPTFNPTPGEPYPHIVVVEGPALIYGSFPLNNPDAFAYEIIDTIIKTPNPVDTMTYRDSLVPLLISPSITVDLAGIPHILWEGDSTAMRYYTITDSVISRQLFDINTSNNVDFPSLAANGDQVQLLWTASDSIRYCFGWTNTEHLSQPLTIAACENPVASGPYLAWTKQDEYLSYLYYGAIPASGLIDPVEINYSTDLISYPQILYNPEKQNQTPSLDLIWTEYSQLDSLGYVYYLNLPLTEEASVYSFDMGTETPVPVLMQRDGFLAYNSENFKTIDYDSMELIYHLTLHSPHKKYRIKWTYYHQEPDKIKLDFSIDDIMHHNRWVDPNEQVTQEAWIPDSCLQDNEITIKVKKLSGTLAVLSGFEIYERITGGGGPQGSEVMISRPFSLERIYPNPAKGMIKIRFNSPDERYVSIKLYDVTGRLVEKLFTGRTQAGMNEVAIMTSELANGIYFMKLDADKYSKVEKLILLK